MTRLKLATRDTFRSLRSRNYRLYFLAQIVSFSGTWMQGVAQAWLVLELSGSGTVLGLVTALQFLPILVAGPWGGVIADRIDKHRLLMITQTTFGVLALVLGVLTATGAVELWMVFALAFAFGCVVAIDNPARQSFVLEMVGSDDLPNAITLNSVVVNAARVIGPAIAGVLIASVGLAACFFVNGGSYLAVLAGLVAMRPSELRRDRPSSARKGQLLEGLRYVWATPELRIPLLVMAVVGTLAYEFRVILPLMARDVFGGGAGVYAAMSSMMGIGAVVGGLASARRATATPGGLIRAALVFGVLILGVALAPTLGVELAVLLLLGAASIAFIATANATLQLRAAPEMRGRVMSLWAVAFLGTTPIGGPIIGWVGENAGPRYGLALGGLATLLAATVAHRALRRCGVLPPAARRAAAERAVALDAAAADGGTDPVPSLSWLRPHRVARRLRDRRLAPDARPAKPGSARLRPPGIRGRARH